MGAEYTTAHRKYLGKGSRVSAIGQARLPPVRATWRESGNFYSVTTWQSCAVSLRLAPRMRTAAAVMASLVSILQAI